MMRLVPCQSFGAALTFAAAMLGLTLLAAHFLAPLGLLLSPVALYHSVRPLNAVAARRGWAAAYALATLSLLCLQDVGLNQYAGGTHDSAGRGWISLMTLASAFGVFSQLIDLLMPAARAWPVKTAVLLLFPPGLALYLRYALL